MSEFALRRFVTKYRWWLLFAVVGVAALTFPVYGTAAADFGQSLADSGRGEGGVGGIAKIAVAYAMLPVVLLLGVLAGVLSGLGTLILVFVAVGIIGAAFVLFRRRWPRPGIADQRQHDPRGD